MFWFEGTPGKPDFVDSPRKTFLNVDHWLLHQGAVCTAEQPRTCPLLPEEKASLQVKENHGGTIKCTN